MLPNFVSKSKVEHLLSLAALIISLQSSQSKNLLLIPNIRKFSFLVFYSEKNCTTFPFPVFLRLKLNSLGMLIKD